MNKLLLSLSIFASVLLTTSIESADMINLGIQTPGGTLINIGHKMRSNENGDIAGICEKKHQHNVFQLPFVNSRDSGFYSLSFEDINHLCPFEIHIVNTQIIHFDEEGNVYFSLFMKNGHNSINTKRCLAKLSLKNGLEIYPIDLKTIKQLKEIDNGIVLIEKENHQYILLKLE